MRYELLFGDYFACGHTKCLHVCVDSVLFGTADLLDRALENVHETLRLLGLLKFGLLSSCLFFVAKVFNTLKLYFLFYFLNLIESANKVFLEKALDTI